MGAEGGGGHAEDGLGSRGEEARAPRMRDGALRGGGLRQCVRARGGAGGGGRAGARLPLLRLQGAPVRRRHRALRGALRRRRLRESSTTARSPSTRRWSAVSGRCPTTRRSPMPPTSTRRATAPFTTGSRLPCARRCARTSPPPSSSTRSRGARPPTAPGSLASIMAYGCVGLASGPGMPDGASLAAARRYLGALVAEFPLGARGRGRRGTIGIPPRATGAFFGRYD